MNFKDAWQRSRKKIDMGKVAPGFDQRPAFFSYLFREIARGTELHNVEFVDYAPGGAGRTAIVPIGIVDAQKRVALRVTDAAYIRRNHDLVEEPFWETTIEGLQGPPVYLHFIDALNVSRDPSDVLAMQMYLWARGDMVLGDAKMSNLGINEAGKLKIIDAGNLIKKPENDGDTFMKRIDAAVREILEPRFFEIALESPSPVEVNFKRVSIVAGKDEDREDLLAMKQQAEAKGLAVYHFYNYERMIESEGMLGAEDKIMIPHLMVIVDPAQQRFDGQMTADIRPPHAIRLSRRPKKVGAEWRRPRLNADATQG